jgi:hypothetical protein
MRRVAGKLAIVAAVLLVANSAGLAQEPPVHYYHQGVMPPGAIGSQQLARGGPLAGYYQPVEIKTPNGAMISLAINGQFEEPRKGLRKAGLLVGCVYRLQVTGIPMAEGQEVFPTIEVIDRLFAPLGQEHRFSIPIELSDEDLKLGLAGKFVTRVIYLEDPRDALPVREDPKNQTWFEAAPGQDPLAVADSLGRPVAILRIGGRLPDFHAGPDPQFFFGFPPFVDYPNPPAETLEQVANLPKTVGQVANLPKKTNTVGQVANLPKKAEDRQVGNLPHEKPAKKPVERREPKSASLDEIQASFKFEPKASPKPAVQIIAPPPSSDKTSDPSAKEGPRS